MGLFPGFPASFFSRVGFRFLPRNFLLWGTSVPPPIQFRGRTHEVRKRSTRYNPQRMNPPRLFRMNHLAARRRNRNLIFVASNTAT